ncbi:pyrokinin-1 receptor-like isoform X1 [Centruroides vittatus]|uniref:pyrokinin-1 receptor-like isoform X1 n=1 Tax=Centruroides vittatus TaxID=120091 RepID=UPI00350F91F4
MKELTPTTGVFWINCDGNILNVTKEELLELLMNSTIRNCIKSIYNQSLQLDLPSELDLGPKRDPLTTVISMTIVYALILVTGLIGNICTCVVISRNKYMHTATNYYLFSLAISDLLLLVLGLPQEMYQIWVNYPYIFGEEFCIFRGLTSEMSTNASILTITAFTVERYMAICHPLKAHTMSKLNRAIKIIVAIWLCAAVCAAPLAAQLGIIYSELNDKPILESARCNIKRTFSHSFEISTFVFFILPMTVISVLYVLIALELRRTSVVSRINSETSSNGVTTPLTRIKSRRKKIRSNNQSSRRDVVKLLVAVVVAFFICWAPFHAQRLMAIYVKNPTPTDEIVYMVLTYISGVTYYVSATINPILYSILSVKFRQAFKDTLARCCGRHVPRRDTSYSFRYQSTVRTTGYEPSEMSSTCDSPRIRMERTLQCPADSNNSAKIKFSMTTNNVSTLENKKCIVSSEKTNHSCS